MALVGDGVADDTAAIQALIDASGGGWVELPAGTFRTTADLTRRANAATVPGLKLRGKHPLATTILADYNGDVGLGAVIRLDTTAVSQYTQFSAVEDLTIKQASGRTGLNGIQLTAAWWVDIKNVFLNGLSGSGIITTLRPDIHPTISDYYQSFAITLHNLYIRQCAGWAIKFAAGQSPGLYILENSMIWGNTGGGVMSTTGQCRIVGNAIAENGSIASGGGGLLFDTTEGPSMVADVRQNELDCNWNYNLKLIRSRGLRATQNRFLHCSVADPASWTRTSGGAYMRTPIGAYIGTPNTEVYRALFEQNLHRSVTGPSATSAPVSAYYNGGGDLRQNRIWYNDIDFPDGVTQNSAGTTKYNGFAGTDTSIIDNSGGPPPSASEGVVVVKARATVEQDVYGTITAINFNAKDIDPEGQFSTYYFRPLTSGEYQVAVNLKIKNALAGQNVKVQVWFPGNNLIAFTKDMSASGGSQNFTLTAKLKLSAQVPIAIVATIPTVFPRPTLDISDAAANWIEIRKL